MKVDIGSFKEEQLVRTTISIKLHKLKSPPRLFRPLTGVSIDDFDQRLPQCQVWWQQPVIKQKRYHSPWWLGCFGDASLMPSSWLPLWHQSVILGFCWPPSPASGAYFSWGYLDQERSNFEPELEELIIDCREQPIRRPKKGPKKYDCGKKRWHRLKTEIRLTAKGQIKSVSKSSPGKKHDFEIYQAETPPPVGYRT